MKKSLKMTLATILAVTSWALLPQSMAVEVAKSLRGTDVNAADAPGETKAFAGKRPGTQPMVARSFSTQPPVIPHAVENFDEVTLEENQCLSCHGADVFKKKNAPRVGDSHFLNRDGKKLESASAARHNCVTCHVGQADVPPLVENVFKGDLTAAKKKKSP